MSESIRNQMVQLMLPWFGNHDGELYYSAMSITQPGKVDRRKVFRLVRKWYKEQIGVTVDKLTLERIWRLRHTTWAVQESNIEDYIHQLARDTYEETKAESDTGLQEEAAGGTGL